MFSSALSRFFIAAAFCLWNTTVQAETILMPLYHTVQLAEVIVLGTITDADRAIVRVDETFKGRPERSIQLVIHSDPFARPEDLKPLVAGHQQLMFLKKTGDGYAPLGRWTVEGDRIDSNQFGLVGARETSQTIQQLLRLQAATASERGGRAIRAYVDGLKSANRYVKHWASDTAYQNVDVPTTELVDAYVALWPREAGLLGGLANALLKWQVPRTKPILARDPYFVLHFRSTLFGEPAARVRAFAYEELTYLLGADSFADLWRGSRDQSALVRKSIATTIFDLASRNRDTELRRDLRTLLVHLTEDSDLEVATAANDVLRRFDARWPTPI